MNLPYCLPKERGKKKNVHIRSTTNALHLALQNSEWSNMALNYRECFSRTDDFQGKMKRTIIVPSHKILHQTAAILQFFSTTSMEIDLFTVQTCCA
jgi:hypothetical protein